MVEILDKYVVGKIGEGYSDTLCTIIMNWLGEQGYLAKGKNRAMTTDRDARIDAFERAIDYPKETNKVERNPTEEIDLVDNMLSTLVDLLIEKGFITEEEYEKRVKGKINIK